MMRGRRTGKTGGGGGGQIRLKDEKQHAECGGPQATCELEEEDKARLRIRKKR